MHLYLSPHYDDAALSCGGHIAGVGTAGEQAMVLTVFGGRPNMDRLSPFAQQVHARPSAGEDPVAQRRREEREALAQLGAVGRWGEFLDCIYRQEIGTGRWLYADEQALFGPVDAADQALVDEIAQWVASQVPEPNETTLYSPLAVGNHVDHQIVRQAGARLLAAGFTVLFYEDYPYIVRAPGSLQPSLARLAPADRWRAIAATLSPDDLQAKIKAIGAYRSQLSVLFGGDGSGSEADVAPAIGAFARRTAQACGVTPHAERFWVLDRTVNAPD